MIRLKIATTIGCLLLVANAFCQSQAETLAKRYFDRTFYSHAIPIYERLIEKDRSVDIVRNLADSYYFTNNFPKARPLYQFLVSQFPDAADATYIQRYVQTLKSEGNYKLADDVYRKFLKKTGRTEALNKLEQDIITLENITAIGARFDIRNLPFNTKFSEFGGSQYNGKIVFAGVQRAQSMLEKKFKWNDEHYLNLLAVTSPNDSLTTTFAKELNSNLHESSAIFTKDGRTMYFTRNYFKDGKRGKNGKRVSVVQLYKARYDSGWTQITPLPFNSPDFSVEHPALSPDEKTLYFSSDRPGGSGSFDLWSVSIHNGLYSEPLNLGAAINTDQREQFPFVDGEGKLYFSSDGHYGYGALDVFVSDGKTVYNLGLPLNSGYDDFAFSIDIASKDGFFSSNRPGGKGNDDVYFLHETKPLVVEGCSQEIIGIISDEETKLPIEGAKVIVEISGIDVPEEAALTGVDGSFRFKVACEKTYKVSASKTAYSSNFRVLALKKERGKVNDASMELRSDASVERENKRKLDETKLADEKEKQRRIAEIKAKEKDIVEERGKLVIKTEPIYFDYDLWYIRKESKPILDRVVELMKKYPEMVVEIGSHTDVRGTFKYNEELSSKRAASTLDYVLEHGIPSSRISAKGYGESQPIIPCVPDASCNEEQHELNRRSEFVIKKL